MPTNSVEIEGVVKWEPRVFPPQKEGQKPIMVFAVEYADKNERKSVFHMKAYGDLAQKLDEEENLAQGDSVLVKGLLNEARWMDKKTDEWVNRIEVWANTVEFKERAGGDGGGEFAAATAGAADDDIPF